MKNFGLSQERKAMNNTYLLAINRAMDKKFI